MTREKYLAAVLGLYLEAPDTPSRPRRRDWAIAADLYRQATRLDDVAHAIRLATLRRQAQHHPSPGTIHSLAYYRTVLRGLTDDDLDPGYVAHVRRSYHRLLLTASPSPEPRLRSQSPLAPRLLKSGDRAPPEE